MKRTVPELGSDDVIDDQHTSEYEWGGAVATSVSVMRTQCVKSYAQDRHLGVNVSQITEEACAYES